MSAWRMPKYKNKSQRLQESTADRNLSLMGRNAQLLAANSCLTASIYDAICLLQTGQHMKAIHTLNEAINSATNIGESTP